MRENKITKMVEQYIRTEYIAEDGTVFVNKEECEKYEESALFAVKKELRRFNKNYVSSEDFYGRGYEDQEVEIFDIQTEKDLENLKRYIYLVLKKNYVSEDMIKTLFSREIFGIDNITIGHEVIICWSCEYDWVHTHYDGSVNGYLKYMEEHMKDVIKRAVEK